jgi:peptide/nickel transport system permease protein
MLLYVVRRLSQAVLVLWLAFTISFVLLEIVPGDAALARLGNDVSLTPGQIAALRDQLGLNRPLYTQYLHQLSDIVRGNFGDSMITGVPVSHMIASALPSTFAIAAPALVLSVMLGAALAIAATYTRVYWVRSLLLSLPSVGVSTPLFWIGTVLLWIFAYRLGWFPSYGTSGWNSLVLPVVTLAISPTAMIAQVLAASLESAQSAPYAHTAQAKGASRFRIIMAHCLRNAAIPSLTLAGILTGTLLTGAVVTETVFSRNGIGRVVLGAVQQSDLPVVQAVVVICAVIFVAVSLLVDLSYPILDPRLRGSAGRG